MRTFLVLGLLTALALAGCSGGNDASDTQSVSTSTQTNVGNTTVSGSISAGPDGAAGNGSVNDPNGNASLSWSYDNRTGTLSGNGAVVNVPFTKEESFTVQDAASRLFLNLTATGSDLTMAIRAADCTSDDCVERVKTAGGSASYEANQPGSGDWLVTLELEGTGPVQAEYALEIAQLGAQA